MEHGFYFLVALVALLLGHLSAQLALAAPGWLQTYREWSTHHPLSGRRRPYPPVLLYLAVQAKPAFVRLIRPNPSLLARAELQGWTYWDEPFERALQFTLSAFALFWGALFALLAGLEGPLALAILLLLGLAAWLDPPRRLQSANRVAKENCLDGMPSLLDGMVIALEAGQSLSRSMEVSLGRGCRKGDEEWVAAMRQALEDMRRGLGVEPAFSRLRRVLPIPVVYRFAATCVLGETQGQSIAGVLKRQAEQCRREAQMAIEKRALQAPVKLMAPLMICIFPCTFLVLLAPLSRSLLSVGGI